jgi:hypothetical protein
MNNLEVITAQNASRLDQIGLELAETYKTAFAGPPWNERSRCPEAVCSMGFTPAEPGCSCNACGGRLVEVYNATDLLDRWKQMLNVENAYMEVAYDFGLPQRATIARPTNPDELFDRKYAGQLVMKDWLNKKLRSELVWIEDTFANRERQPTGNLTNRGRTLSRIAAYYGGLTVATRTLAPQIVASTHRDLGAYSTVYIGSEGVGREIVNDSFTNPGYALPTVPDTRTLLVVNAPAPKKDASWE